MIGSRAPGKKRFTDKGIEDFWAPRIQTFVL